MKDYIMNKLNVGDVIKSRDFAGNNTCYIIGKVIKYDNDTGEIECKGIIQVWENELQDECPEEFITVDNGYLPFDNQFGDRITVIA